MSTTLLEPTPLSRSPTHSVSTLPPHLCHCHPLESLVCILIHHPELLPWLHSTLSSSPGSGADWRETHNYTFMSQTPTPYSSALTHSLSLLSSLVSNSFPPNFLWTYSNYAFGKNAPDKITDDLQGAKPNGQLSILSLLDLRATSDTSHFFFICFSRGHTEDSISIPFARSSSSLWHHVWGSQGSVVGLLFFPQPWWNKLFCQPRMILGN